MKLPNNVVTHARVLAEAAHFSDWNDKADEAYIKHPMRVADHVYPAYKALQPWLGLEPMTTEVIETLRAAAWLHDTIEDTWMTPEIIRASVGPDVLYLVLAVTQSPDETRTSYRKRLKAAGKAAIVLKFADLMDNADPRRLAVVPSQVKAENLAAKYVEDATALDVIRVLRDWQDHRRQGGGVDTWEPKRSE